MDKVIGQKAQLEAGGLQLIDSQRKNLVGVRGFEPPASTSRT